ncbi:hypothetical protein [Syntrophomonas zehnderi]|uniref:hypothetical protein n=1 Tax=Syntrophomonas zehnderi TaxID=404335 RepID=UPI001A9A5EF7|nr:hypothetical protein [Syntrophomonas zehnderi]
MVLAGFVVLATLKGSDFKDLAACASVIQIFVSGFAVWWPIFILKEYLHSPGKELLFVYKARKDILMNKMLLLWGLYALHVVVLFFYFSTLFKPVIYLFIATIIQCLFLIALAYFLALLLQNTFIPLIFNFAYVFTLSMVVFSDLPISIFTRGVPDNPGILNTSVIVLILAGILFWAGYQMEMRLYKNSI